jgi:hypothetical protein
MRIVVGLFALLAIMHVAVYFILSAWDSDDVSW